MKTFDTEDFSIQIPVAFSRESIQGHDTELWQFKAQNNILRVEYGRLASSVYFQDERCPNRSESLMEVSGRSVRSVRCLFNDPSGQKLIVVAAEFEADTQSEKLLVIEVKGTGEIEQSAAEIIKYIKFH
jgi:hypothetical protein